MTQAFVVPVSDLLDREAPPRRIYIEAPVDWAIELSRIEPDPPLSADLTLSPLPGGILGRGTVRFRAEHSCRRCLTPYEEDVELDVAALFEPDPDEDAYPIDVDRIDLEPFLHDEALLGMPQLPQCPDGCDVVVTTPETGLNTDLPDENSPFAVLRDLLPPGG
jgi:uncharacterized metal-binding protein YceD (DUF177 family)